MTATGQEYRILPLTKNQSTIIDADDYERVSKLNWISHWLPEMKRFRAVCRMRDEVLYLHRFILGLNRGDPRVIDHVNGDPLDNRKANLRICYRAENGMNRGKTKRNTTGYKGVRLNRPGQWIAQIAAHGTHHYLGSFSSPEEAHAAYCEAAKIYHGEFARTK